MRRFGRTDGPQQRIADYLRSIGWGVYVSSAVGGGFPDLVCARFLFTALVEVKDPTKPKRDQRLTKDQEQFHRDWPGIVLIAYSPEDAEAKLNAALIRSGAAKMEDLR